MAFLPRRLPRSARNEELSGRNQVVRSLVHFVCLKIEIEIAEGRAFAGPKKTKSKMRQILFSSLRIVMMIEWNE